ncbi:MAG: hypothetical protein OYL41_13950 [Acidobacteriota bacterium]|nr:hypothetical protein [Acidobacteriota bacterium]
MTWSFFNGCDGKLSVRPLETLPEEEAAPWTDRSPPGGLGITGSLGREDRLGWVDLPLTANRELPEYVRLRDELLAEGFERLVVVAIGGSALAPRALVSGLPRGRGLAVDFLDSLAPEAVLETLRPDRQRQTIFLVASKSGTTVETRALEAVIHGTLRGAGALPGRQFLAVTDPGTPLHRWADRAGYRARFAGKVDVGGRFSALSAFGLLPAVLAGCELGEELSGVRRVREALDAAGAAGEPALRLGSLLAGLRAEGRWQAHLTAATGSEGVLPWLEQLFAETTGKEGTGILPVTCEWPHPERRAEASLVIHVGPADAADRERLETGAVAGVPAIHCPPDGCGHLSLLFRWQIAVAIAAFRMGMDPYDQPDVEDTKAAARRLAASPESAPQPPEVSDSEVREFLTGAAAGGLVVNAFGHRTRMSEGLVHALQRQLAARFRVTPAIGFGSGLLHSLGQIEKGGPPDLAVLMLTWDPGPDILIPPSPELPSALAGLGVGEFARLQAAADYSELKRRGRRVLWLDASLPGVGGLAELTTRLITLSA